MSKGRAAKRARQKARRDARREAMVEAVRKRRRQRSFVLIGSVLLLVGVGSLLAFLAFQDEDAATVAPTPEETTLEETAEIKQPVACGAELPETAGSSKQVYSAPEDLGLDPETTNLLRLETSCGQIDIALDVEGSPETANSVAFLVSEGYYDGLVFHRIVPGFVAQAGDVQATGSGAGPGYDVVEPPPEDTVYTRGLVAMAKTGTDPAGSSSSQFFIVIGEDASLPPEYAIAGEVVAGDDVLDEIATFGAGGEQPPTEWVYIERATLVEGADGDEG